MLCKLLAVKEISPVPHRVYKIVDPVGLLMSCAAEFEELESHDKCPEVAASGEVIVDLQQLPCARLRRLAIKDCSLVPFVNTELKRREIQKYMGYSERKLRNIRAAVCNLNFQTTPAKMARQELVRRGEWDYGDMGEEALVAASGLACVFALCVFRDTEIAEVQKTRGVRIRGRRQKRH